MVRVTLGQPAMCTIAIDFVGISGHAGSKIAESLVGNLWADVGKYMSIVWWSHSRRLKLSWDRPQIGLLPILEKLLVRHFVHLGSSPMLSHYPYAGVILGAPAKRSERTPRSATYRFALLLIPL